MKRLFRYIILVLVFGGVTVIISLIKLRTTGKNRKIDADVLRYTEPISCSDPATVKEYYDFKLLLSLATTFKDDPSKTNIYRNTLKNWAALKPEVQPYLYVHRTEDTNNGLLKEAEALGWIIREVKYVAEMDLPIMPDIMADLHSISQSEFYGFANGDTLFTFSLLDTLSSMAFHAYSTQQLRILLTGLRNEIPMEEGSTFAEKEFWDPHSVELFARDNPPVYRMANAIEYLIVHQVGMPWKCAPPLVVGRAGFETWVITKARQWGYDVVEVSNSLLAVHQSQNVGEFSCEKAPLPDVNFRKTPEVPHEKGIIICCGMATIVNTDGEICVLKRNTVEQCAELQPEVMPNEDQCVY